MRTLKLKKCNRIHGLHFAPDGGQLIVVGGDEVDGVNDIAWFDLATGNVTRRLEVVADRYRVSNDFRRLVLGTDVHDRPDLGNLIQYCDPLADEDDVEWQTLPAWGHGLGLSGGRLFLRPAKVRRYA